MARSSGVAGQWAACGHISDADRTEALVELRKRSLGRADLLAAEAGIMLGFASAKSGVFAKIDRLTAELCIQGRRRVTNPRVEKVGRARADAARAIPYTGADSASAKPMSS
jgi:NADP-dependent 3-hydroxy acid dehydrogenase YdfG